MPRTDSCGANSANTSASSALKDDGVGSGRREERPSAEPLPSPFTFAAAAPVNAGEFGAAALFVCCCRFGLPAAAAAIAASNAADDAAVAVLLALESGV